MRTQEAPGSKPESDLLLDSRYAITLISDLIAFRTVRSRHLSFEPPAGGTQLQQPQLTKTVQEGRSQGLGDGSLRHSQSEIQMLLKTRVGQPLTFPELSMSRPTPEATSRDDSGRGGGAAGWVGGTFLVCGAAPPCCSAEPAWPRVHQGGGFGAQAARGAPGSGVGQWMRHDLPSLAFCVDPPRASVFSRKTRWSSALGSSLSSSDRSSGRSGQAVLRSDRPQTLSLLRLSSCP